MPRGGSPGRGQSGRGNDGSLGGSGGSRGNDSRRGRSGRDNYTPSQAQIDRSRTARPGQTVGATGSQRGGLSYDSGRGRFVSNRSGGTSVSNPGSLGTVSVTNPAVRGALTGRSIVDAVRKGGGQYSAFGDEGLALLESAGLLDKEYATAVDVYGNETLTEEGLRAFYADVQAAETARNDAPASAQVGGGGDRSAPVAKTTVTPLRTPNPLAAQVAAADRYARTPRGIQAGRQTLGEYARQFGRRFGIGLLTRGIPGAGTLANKGIGLLTGEEEIGLFDIPASAIRAGENQVYVEGREGTAVPIAPRQQRDPVYDSGGNNPAAVRPRPLPRPQHTGAAVAPILGAPPAGGGKYVRPTTLAPRRGVQRGIDRFQNLPIRRA